MSLSWREWLKEKSNYELNVTTEERVIVNDKMYLFCGFSDNILQKQFKEKIDPSKVFDLMPEEQKLDFTREVIDQGLKFLKIRKIRQSAYADTGELTEVEIQGRLLHHG